MKVTQSNLHYVAMLLRNYLRYGFNTQTFYPEAKKFNNVLRYYKIKNHELEFFYKIEKSNNSYFQQGIIEIESNYIRIHNGAKRNYDDWYNNGYHAMLVRVGDEIKFNKGLIRIRCSFVCHNAKCNVKITF